MSSREKVAMSNPYMPAYVYSISGSLQKQHFVIRGCNIDANMVPNSHAGNGVTFNRKVSNMKSKCDPEGVPKTDQKAISNGNLRFWTRSGESA